MKLYLITTDVGGYDSYDGHVVAAEDERDARNFCLENAAVEGVKAWNTKHAECRIVADKTSEPAGLVLSSFNAG